ncbi:hypothetical protein R50076_06670 [Gilvimarinus japonicus]
MKPSDYFTPEYVQLINLIEKGKKEQAQALIDQGLPLDIYGKYGITPLFWFIATNDISGTELVLELGADPNLPEKQYGNTPLNKVIGGETKYDVWVTLLLEYGADPNIVDSTGRPPLFRAVVGSSLSQIDILIKHGANVNLHDKTGRNAALYAAFLNEYKLVYHLIEQGADPFNYSQGGADIAWCINDALNVPLIKAPSENYDWAMKVKAHLESQGVQFPPPSPAKVRAQWEKEGRYD